MALPKSLLFFAATGAVFLLQLFPYTGVFLMFLLAPFWPVVLVNLGFIGIALEAASGQVTRLWLILPTAWFGAYTWFAVADYGALERLQHDIAAANDSVRVTFNPSQQALVITDASDPRFLVTNYALSVVYVRNTNRAGSSHAAVRMVETEVCAKVRAGRSLSAAGIYTHGFHEGRLLERRFCVLRLPEDPTLPEVTVEVDTRRATEGGLPVTLTTTTVTTSDGARHVLRGGHVAPLRWFPMPVIGCSLNSAAASWDCIAEFNRRRFTRFRSRIRDTAPTLSYSPGRWASATSRRPTAALPIPSRFKRRSTRRCGAWLMRRPPTSTGCSQTCRLTLAVYHSGACTVGRASFCRDSIESSPRPSTGSRCGAAEATRSRCFASSSKSRLPRWNPIGRGSML
jgi:hypothetical protein